MMNPAVRGGSKGNIAHPLPASWGQPDQNAFFFCCCPGSESCSHTREETSRATQKIGEQAFPFPKHPGRALGPLAPESPMSGGVDAVGLEEHRAVERVGHGPGWALNPLGLGI